MVGNRFLLEFQAYSDTLAAEKTERFSTGDGFQTKRSETPSSATYLPLLKDAGNVENYLYGRGRTTGSFSISGGSVVLNNMDGELDYLKTYGLDGRDLVIREQTGASYPGDFPIRFAGTIDFPSFTDRTVQFDIRNRTANIKTLAYQPKKYAGTNDGATIYVEGTNDDIGGAPKPKLRGGKAENFEPILVNAANEIYQISSDPVYQINAVYVGRSVITAGTVYPTYAAFESAVLGGVTAGQYFSYLGDPSAAEGTKERGCYFAFGTTPNRRVTVDATEGWTNLLTYSNTFSNAAWTKTGVSVADSISTAPDATMGMASLTEDSASSEHKIVRASGATIASGRTYTASIYIKPSGRTQYRIQIADSGGSNGVYATVTLSGAIPVATGVIGSGSDVTATAELIDAIRGIYRLTVTGKVNAGVTSTYMTLFAMSGSGSTTYTGNSSIAGYVWEAQLEVGTFATPPSNTEAATYLKNSFGQLAFRILQEKGFVLDPISVYNMDQLVVSDSSSTKLREIFLQHYQDADEENTGEILDMLAASVHGYIVGTIDEKFVCGRFSLPTVSEVELIVDTATLVTIPKIKIIESNDEDRGIPVKRVNIGYRQNYTLMGLEEDLSGVALSDIAFTDKQFRIATEERASVAVKHLNAPEKNLDTKLTTEADALAMVEFEADLYETYRPTIEIKIPRDFGKDIQLGDVIQLQGKIYRVTGRADRFPSSDTSDAAQEAIQFQAWGGVSV